MRVSPQFQLEDIPQGRHQRPSIVTCIPSFGMVSLKFHFASARLQFPVNGVCQQLVKEMPSADMMAAQGEEVGKARNWFVEECLKLDPLPKYIFMFGDDMLPDWDAALLLHEEIEKGEFDCLAGLYYWKGIPPTPITWREDHVGRPIPGKHYQLGEVIYCDVVGMDFTMIRTEVLRDIPSPWFQTGPGYIEQQNGNCGITYEGKPVEDIMGSERPICFYTEDVFFCRKFRKYGGRVGCHTGIRVSHLDVKTGMVW